MKKIVSLLIIAMFVMSAVPVAFAENGTDSDDSDNRMDDSDDRSTDDNDAKEETDIRIKTNDGELRIRERIELKDGELRTRERIELSERSKERTDEMRQEYRERSEELQERVKTRLEEGRERVEEARERYEDAKERYEETRERYKESKGKVVEVRERFKECTDDNTTECQEVRVKMRTKAKPFLDNSADLVLDALERAYAHVEASDMSAEEKATLLVDLEVRMAEIEAAKEVIENLDGESTDEEIKEAAAIIREAWQEARQELKKATGHVINAKLGNVIKQVEQLSERLERTRDKLEEKGYDVTTLDEQLDEFDAKLNAAKDEWQFAVDLYAGASAGEVDEIAQEAHEHVKKAQEYLKEAREMLREIVKEIRAQSGSVDIESDDNSDDSMDDVEEEEEVEVEVETETEVETESEDDSDDASEEATEDGSDESADDENETEDDENESEEESEDDESDDDDEPEVTVDAALNVSV